MTDILKNKKNLINFLILLILILAVPIGINLIQRQQVLKSKAATGSGGVIFSGPNVQVKNNKTILKLMENSSGGLEAKADLIITAPNPPASSIILNPTPTGTSSVGGNK